MASSISVSSIPVSQPKPGSLSWLKSRLSSSTKAQSKNTRDSPSIVLPLYIYPDPGAWDPIFQSITSNPTLSFIIVINPSSGPGTTQFPDEEYIAGITTLNSFPNTRLLGYVHTTNASRSLEAVKADITTYTGWEAHTPSNIRMAGIFFDESPGAYSAPGFAYMKAAAEFARQSLGPGRQFVLSNPGVVVDERWYGIVDMVNAFEDYHRSWRTGITALEKVPASLRAKTSFMVHHLEGGAGELKELVERSRVWGVGGLFVSDLEYNEVSGLWKEFCGSVSKK